MYAQPAMPQAELPPRPDANAQSVRQEISHALAMHESPLVGQQAVEKISPVDAMGANANAEPPEPECDDRFYGSSSAVSFMQQVYRTIRNGDTSPTAASPNYASNRFQSGLEAEDFPSLTNLEQFSLLPQPLMDKALKTYWDCVYHLYPFVHWPTFMSAYEQLWLPPSTNEELLSSDIGLLGSKLYGPTSIIFHCAMNLMLALATQFMDIPPEDRSKFGQFFFREGSKFVQARPFRRWLLSCHPDTTAHDTVPTVDPYA
ncbi:hypothetical protein H2198_004261 [Neophaeococcomyces mojaviensis]|uniref:Uncharacterized protein n=1 Tax=Neophaeococcomyces mojaviensis TaxID=3383035 RepID=A0ACC3A9C6_9EURO|nr:hypothetical protein H2198_004261 [Knufia sp. JES_112]